ncbi:uncharacterized protein BO95DRAFT_472459 [Aspergillus brunneoviolaceus CBS 621.78]|uniref:Uncharacterized protein n=1 Tax=Aspergillus brunneoviolaceus CBS 621.78 TaxID=1450534 RepID=A0ACD1GDD1_9EURO|nr:hypothetical protein BO95DRAFT_472459 [Aspergillus brunneoviolaceus CBS 621.78]RAH47232.1 hypothetical protein BO95DRAFT_472459 [Aspergillus brunneoviolaceus CBS 621.78]
MAATGARAQKPVGSAAWISSEKENCMQLVDQEMEEVEYPVRHEMDWLNEHMAEIFSTNQFNFTDAFKTPGKLRGKTPRTARKRDATEPRVPLSEIFSSAHNSKTENKLESKHDSKPPASPAVQRSPAKAPVAPPAAPTPVTEPKTTTTNEAAQPAYPDLSKNLNSFPEYNTDSGYHGMPEGEEMEEDEEDDVVLTQVQPESQTSTQPMETEPIATEEHTQLPEERRMTANSFHSAQENVRHRGETVEPEQVEPTPSRNAPSHSQPQTEPKEQESAVTPAPELEEKPETEAVREPEDEPEPETEVQAEPEARPEVQQPEAEEEPAKAVEPSSPAKTPAAPAAEPVQEGKEDAKDEMALDIDDIGSPSDVSPPARPPIRKSSLSFASLPAREPLTKKSLGGSRLSRTSHLEISKLSNTGSYLGRQTGGHRTTQSGMEDDTTHNDKMDIDDNKDLTDDGESDVDTKASKVHTKSSTQRLHEKISMLGKLQPSRPTKSIPAVSRLSTAQVTYPDLPISKPETRPEVPSQKPRDAPTAEPMQIDDDWIKPMNSPYRSNTQAHQRTDSKDTKLSGARILRAAEDDRSSAIDNTRSATGTTTTAKRTSDVGRGKSTTPLYSSPQRPGHQKSASAHIDSQLSTTPVGSPAPERWDGPLSASKSRLQSIVQSAKGLFTNTGGVAAAARKEASSPEQPRLRPSGRPISELMDKPQRPQSAHILSPPRQEGRRTRSSTEREEKRRQMELEKRERQEEHESRATSEAPAAPTSQRLPKLQKSSKETEFATETESKPAAPSSIPQQQQAKGRPVKPTRETLQKPRPQPVSIRVGSALSRPITLGSSTMSSGMRESSVPAPTPGSAVKPPTLKKKASNSSLHTASSNSSFKSSMSTQSQRKAQLASERKREQEEREARRREEQRRELERKRAAQQQEEARRQDMRSRAEAERRERIVAEDPKKAAQLQAIEKRRLESQRRLERQGSQQPETHPERSASQAAQRSELGTMRPASRLGSIQPFHRSVNQPQPNPAKPPKRGLDEEANQRPTALKTGTVQPAGESKRRRTEDEQNRMSSMRPTMAPPIRQSNIRKEPKKPSFYSQPPTSILKTGQTQRPAHPMDMSKYASGKIPFAEPPMAPPAAHRTPAASSSQKHPVKESPSYPNGENINLPEIATDSEDEDSDAEMLPVPKWAQPKELESLLRQQEGMEADSIFGPIAPFSLEETFKGDKKIKKFRERTSSAHWSGPDGLTQDEIRRDLAERQRLRLNGGWTFN